MPKGSNPVDLLTGHLTKQQIEERQAAEAKLKGDDTLVYIPPTELSTKKEKEIYQFLVDEMKASKILNNLDIQLIIQTVDSIMNMREAKKAIRKYGQVIQKADGTLCKNPAVNIYKEYSQIYYQCAMQLGLSPSSRSKLALDSTKKKENDSDPLLKVIGGGKK